jgi:predicted nucleic acid-binding protein
LRAALHYGEGALVIIDDLAARRIAAERGIPFTGTAGVVVEAKRAGLIKAVRPMLERLAEIGFRLSPELVEAILHEVGEA